MLSVRRPSHLPLTLPVLDSTLLAVARARALRVYAPTKTGRPTAIQNGYKVMSEHLSTLTTLDAERRVREGTLTGHTDHFFDDQNLAAKERREGHGLTEQDLVDALALREE